jgi:hypothetical protein
MTTHPTRTKKPMSKKATTSAASANDLIQFQCFTADLADRIRNLPGSLVRQDSELFVACLIAGAAWSLRGEYTPQSIFWLCFRAGYDGIPNEEDTELLREELANVAKECPECFLSKAVPKGRQTPRRVRAGRHAIEPEANYIASVDGKTGDVVMVSHRSVFITGLASAGDLEFIADFYRDTIKGEAASAAA